MTLSTFSSATELAAAIRGGEVTSVAVVQAHLDRIHQHNPALNAVVTLDAAHALARAAEADAATRRGRSWGPLHGVPITVKDSFETAGLRTTSSHPPLARHVPARDATTVARLRQAGAVVLGKTNLPELERDVQAWSPVFGHANNPWDLSRTPGGSTGGGAAAVAAGLSALELGSDTAGSVRIPAHYTGTFALKPTHRRVSLAGRVPPRPDQPRGIRHLAVPGVIARSVDDLGLWLDVVQGLDPADPDTVAAPAPASAPELKEVRDLHLAWVEELPGVPVEAATRAAVAGVAAGLEGAGARVERAAPPFAWLEALSTYAQVWGAECGLGLPGTVQRLAPLAARLTPRRELVARAVARGMRLDMPGYAEVLTRRDALIRAFEEFLGAYDAWLLPVTAGPAFTHRRPGLLRQPDPIDVDGRQVPYDLATLGMTAPLSVLGNPVVTIPTPRPPGALPLGVQVVARHWQDHALLSTARAITRVTGGFTPPPGRVGATSPRSRTVHGTTCAGRGDRI